MKLKFILIVFTFLSCSIYAQSDSLYTVLQEQVSVLQTQVESSKSRIAEYDKSIKSLSVSVKNLELEDARLQSGIEQNGQTIASESSVLRSEITSNKEESVALSTQISGDLSNTRFYGIIASLILLVLSVCGIVLYVLLKKANTTSFEKIKDAQKILEEESLKLDGKLVEILEKQMQIQKESTSTNKEQDHSLALKVADEIIRIETNLSRMGADVKGYKQLSASVRRIKDNFLANGYEMVDMLGKPYKEGMKAIVNFESDDSLEEGQQIITGVIKPQINYNGVMIQAAQITVSQNV